MVKETAEFLRQEWDSGASKTTLLAMSEAHPNLAQLSSMGYHELCPSP